MKYLEEDDLTADSYQRFITDSSNDIENIVDKNEARAIALVQTYLSDRYDIGSIFGQTLAGPPIVEVPPLRNELLVDIISKITLYKIFRRNAARKLSEDIKDDFNWAITQLERINAGRVILDLPPVVDDDGNVVSDSIWGDLTNTDFYI